MTSLVLAAAEHGSKTSHNPLLPHIYDLVWGVVVFLIISIVFYIYVLPRFNAVLDERTETIRAGLENAETAEKKLAAANSEAQAILDEAYRQAAQVREDASEQGRKIIAQAKLEATNEANRVAEVARAQLAADQLAAQESLRSDIGTMATNLAEKIVGEHLEDEALTSRVIDRFLDELDREMVA
ncbi:hypothetical protein BSR29_06405 [Boudabousia liubingyangii]|uniref:ATP synthase subunit b n=1 Tax=Boudabousia liubingyangii TaxID=1921764 RepID=A0A1Q5PKT7_9ACTO|nr:F0F1 ATP synthase subunit B [Boudabousia liubingyangii]OKL46431.1 hypothetical protein BSR28_07875 [Boudabousia liubingyangii]OKL47246.1 hypothetical protein BSR29_06405 [Boudabousia liubingyangii]